MSKKRFVQTVIARSLPTTDKRQSALGYALELWDWLTQQGYGADPAATPREGKLWTAALSDEQAKAFAAFWAAFGYKKGVQRAAMRWHQLGDLSREQYQVIIDAARQEAQKQLPPGQARKMAEGWLFERRWEDYAKPQADQGKLRILELNRLHNERAGLQSLHSANPQPVLQQQIDTLTDKINVLKTGG